MAFQPLNIRGWKWLSAYEMSKNVLLHRLYIFSKWTI